MKHVVFSNLVKKSWSKAVLIASNNFERYRPELLKALNSYDTEERAAAVASFNESNDADAHDYILPLLDDPDQMVRTEAAEYLKEFGIREDVSILLDRIERNQSLRFLLTCSLQSITGRKSGLIDENDPPETRES